MSNDRLGDPYMDEIVVRTAPRWAWEIIDETLDLDRHSIAFSKDLRQSISEGIHAMNMACENDPERLTIHEVRDEMAR